MTHYLNVIQIRENLWYFLGEVSDISDIRRMVVSDFHVCSKEWENVKDNRQAVALSQALLSTDLKLLNDGHPTRLASRSAGTNGVIDLALMPLCKV